MSDQQQKSSINWGGLTKGLLATGAIVAGVEMVFPGMMSGMADSISKIGAEAAPTPDPSFVEKGVGAVVGGFGKAIGTVAIKIGGIALAIMGVTHLVSHKSDRDNAAEHAQNRAERQESFALREDIRRAQATMMARMQSAGHDPAMAGDMQR